MASTVAGHKRAFGTDTVPGTYEDLEEADLVVLVGSNLAWCHPVLYQRLVAARQARGTKVVVIDPRRTATCDIADLHLKLAPGTDVALFNGLFAYLWEVGALDKEFIFNHTTGFDDTFTQATADDPDSTGLQVSEIDAFYRLFATTERVVTVFSQGVNQSSSGTDKVNAIINCHLATGRIGKPGMGPFSVTGQPNAMGGRETGGLANMLAAHLDLENESHRSAVATFWDAPNIADRPGLKAVDMFRAVEDGRIKALWIACTNPVVSLPDADRVARAIEASPFTVVSDLTRNTDTARLADLVLPALGWGEKDGTVTNSDRTISRQRAALPVPGQARPDWAIFAEVGRRMGWTKAFDYRDAAEVFREHAALSGLARRFGSDFDISRLSTITSNDYNALEPVRWPISAARQGGRFFANGQFFTDNGHARLVPVSLRPMAGDVTGETPYRLNTGRVRDQWHTMTRTARAPRLARHLGEPYLQIHPSDAMQLGLKPADLVQVEGQGARTVLRVMVSDDVAPGHPFAPMHWTGETAPAARVGPVIAAVTDPVSGQPESKASVVSISKFDAAWYGFAVSIEGFTPDCAYWSRTRCSNGWRAELAGVEAPADWGEFAREFFGIATDPEMLTDPARKITRLAFTEGDRLIAALFVAPDPVGVARDFIAGLLGSEADGILAARAGGERSDPGPIVCACMGVGRNQVLAAIDGAGANLEAVCRATGAGTNCGSCRPEVADLIARQMRLHAAE